MIISSTCPISLGKAKEIFQVIRNKEVKERIQKFLSVLEAPHSNLAAVELGRRIYFVLRPIIMSLHRKDVRGRMKQRARDPNYDTWWQ